MRYRVSVWFAAIAVMIWAQNGSTAQWTDPIIDFSGYLETRHGLQTKNPNKLLASETLLRPEIRMSGNNVELFAAADVSENHLNQDESGIELHEAYVDYVSSAWDIRLGRQIITWGNADGVRITDNICPSDFTEYLTRDFDEIRIAVDALKFRWFSSYGTAELIYIPFFKDGISPEPDSPWWLNGIADVITDNSHKPEKKLKNGEIALKFAFFLPGLDCALSYFYTWNDFPVYYSDNPLDSQALVAVASYSRIHIYGLEFSIPYNDLVLRGEAAFSHGRLYQAQDTTITPSKKDDIQCLLGVDWYPGNQWILLCQLVDKRILNHSGTISAESHSTLVTLNLSKDLFREKVTISAMHYRDLNFMDSLTRVSTEYQPVDGCILSIGADIFSGDKNGDFGKYKNNTQVWTKIKYHF